MGSSTAMASANPPVMRMPIAPAPVNEVGSVPEQVGALMLLDGDRRRRHRDRRLPKVVLA
jgi:hypothetical protein